MRDHTTITTVIQKKTGRRVQFEITEHDPSIDPRLASQHRSAARSISFLGRVLAAVDGGMAARAAAKLDRISVSYIYPDQRVIHL